MVIRPNTCSPPLLGLPPSWLHPSARTVYHLTKHPAYRILWSFQTRPSLGICTPPRREPDHTFHIHPDGVVWYIYHYQPLLLLKRTLARFTGAGYFTRNGRAFPRAFFSFLTTR